MRIQTAYCCQPAPSRTDPSELLPSPQPTEFKFPLNRTALAEQVMQKYRSGRVDLLPQNVSGVKDGADALSNVRDTAAGRRAKRSRYGRAPGGSVLLSQRMLRGILELSKKYSLRITSIAGGSHSSRSRHYSGIAFDVDTINGRRVSRSHPKFRQFMAEARRLGATEVLGPGSRGHSGHVHVAWPRGSSFNELA